MGRHPGAGGGVAVHGAPTCGRRPQGCYDRSAPGAMAQLVARLVRNEKVGGSNPPSSTTSKVCPARILAGQFCFYHDFRWNIDVDCLTARG